MDPSGGDLPSSTLPRFLCGAASLPAGRGLDGAGDVLRLVVCLAKQCLARLIALLVGVRNLRHLLAVPPAREAALVGGGVGLEQRRLLRQVRGDLLLRLQVLLEELVVVGGIGP